MVEVKLSFSGKIMSNATMQPPHLSKADAGFTEQDTAFLASNGIAPDLVQARGLSQEHLQRLLEAKTLTFIEHHQGVPEEDSKPRSKASGLFSRILPHKDEEQEKTEDQHSVKNDDSECYVLAVPMGENEPAFRLNLTMQEMIALKSLGNNLLTPDGRAYLLEHPEELMAVAAGREEIAGANPRDLSPVEMAHRACHISGIHPINGVEQCKVDAGDTYPHPSESPAFARPAHEIPTHDHDDD